MNNKRITPEQFSSFINSKIGKDLACSAQSDVPDIKLAQPRNPYYWRGKGACRNTVIEMPIKGIDTGYC